MAKSVIFFFGFKLVVNFFKERLKSFFNDSLFGVSGSLKMRYISK